MKLPLFPLHTVLFPGMPLTLHIFEERYKVMISRCIAEQKPFGVVLIRTGSEVEGFGPSAETFTLGCTASITQVQKSDLGRLNLLATGHERFQIDSFDRSQPYLQGYVRTLPLRDSELAGQEQQAQSLQANIRQYLRAVARLENIEFDARSLPTDALELAYLGASLLKLPLVEKQALLEIDSATLLVDAVSSLFRKEVALFQIINQAKTPDQGMFSLN